MNPKANTSNKPIDECHNYKVVFKKPISCPWSNLQPCPSSLNKNRPGDLSTTETTNIGDISTAPSVSTDKSPSSLHQSSSQFFYFLRLMQLFPETHPATLHTVLSISKNDFFSAVDKLLYARRCKSLFTRNQTAGIRRHPFCKGHSYYCYTNNECRGTKRPWDRDQDASQEIGQDTTQVEETVETLDTGKDIVNKEVLNLTTRNEDEKAIPPSSIHQ
ncbi:unnamed protein product [Phaedon cochleariae]|uniref:Uncharacterized protein n=1 Tax=Phaedon cochleariae TaxID=80249 RepID=A0A9N9X4V9_PHACE|nr:unnamed protein product [Phaedon cochleariae]